MVEDPRLHCSRCKVDVVWPAAFGDKEKYRLAVLARGSPILAIRQAREELGLPLDAAKMLMTHVTRQRHKCQYCRGDAPPGASVCAICGRRTWTGDHALDAWYAYAFGIEHRTVMRPPPRVVLQPGLFRSASTWASNVIAELMRLDAPASLLYADSAQAIADQIGAARQAVVKTHHPDRGILLLAHLARMPVVITVRDPLDCIVSLIEQFYQSFDYSATVVIGSAERMVALLDICEPLVVPYEGNPRDASSVARIADHIGAAADEAHAAAIAEKLSAKAVAALIDGLVAEGYFGPEPGVDQFHGETHWHPGHLGSGESGRHSLVLAAEQIAAVDGATQAFRRRFGYLRPGEA